jgi:hypothetical protein
MKKFIVPCLCVVCACGGDGAPTSPISPSAVQGSYSITLSGAPRSCDVVNVNINGAVASWAGVACDYAGNAAEVKGDTILLKEPGGSVGFKFFGLVQRGAEILSSWRGPCTIPVPGAAGGCERESGSATWRRS